MIKKKVFTKTFKCFFIIFWIILNLYFLKINNYNNENNSSIHNIQLNNNYYTHINDINLYFNLSLIKYSFSFKYNITKLEYNFGFYDYNQQLLLPSDLTLYYNLHIFCHITEINKNISIISLSNIYNNKFYNCIEFYDVNEKMNFSIKIYKKDNFIQTFIINLYLYNKINYNSNIFLNNNDFNPLIIKKEFFNKIIKKKNNTKIKNLFLFKNSLCFFKSNKKFINSKWYFQNLFNLYFCFCKYSNHSKCSYSIPKKCKYFFYLYIIDNNKNIYNKTEYLFADFHSKTTAAGDAFLIFKEMIKKNLNAHYMTKRKDIYKKYSNSILYKNLSIIYGDININGDFLEKYLNLFLKLKAVIAGAYIYSINNLFYNIDYITYICLGHGISYIKDYLYKDYYGINRYNKIILPPSDKIILNAKKYGWNDDNIIKIGLPRWDIFVEYENKIKYNYSKLKHSIFIMFTWRKIKTNQHISKYYFKNIFKFINNYKLNIALKKNDINLFFSLHHNLIKYKKNFIKNKLVKYIQQKNIVNCLKKSSLVITDFSSIIFDFFVRKKPYIIYIPDSEDSNLNKIYSTNYYNIINGFINGTIAFENKFFNIKKAVNKIIFYIKNNFILDEKLEKFYDEFKLKGGNNTQKIIDYLENLN